MYAPYMIFLSTAVLTVELVNISLLIIVPEVDDWYNAGIPGQVGLVKVN